MRRSSGIFLVRVAPERLLNGSGWKLGLTRMLNDIDAWSVPTRAIERRSHSRSMQGASSYGGELLDLFRATPADPECSCGEGARPPWHRQDKAGARVPPGKARAGRFTALCTEQLRGHGSLPEGVLVQPPGGARRGGRLCRRGGARPAGCLRCQGDAPRVSPAAHHPDEGVCPALELDLDGRPAGEGRGRQLLDAAVAEPIDENARASIISLAEGFPWFVVLLAREMHRGRGGPEDMTEAVDWAPASLAPRPPGGAAGVSRARALLAVALTCLARLGQPERTGAGPDRERRRAGVTGCGSGIWPASATNEGSCASSWGGTSSTSPRRSWSGRLCGDCWGRRP